LLHLLVSLATTNDETLGNPTSQQVQPMSSRPVAGPHSDPEIGSSIGSAGPQTTFTLFTAADSHY